MTRVTYDDVSLSIFYPAYYDAKNLPRLVDDQPFAAGGQTVFVQFFHDPEDGQLHAAVQQRDIAEQREHQRDDDCGSHENSPRWIDEARRIR